VAALRASHREDRSAGRECDWVIKYRLIERIERATRFPSGIQVRPCSTCSTHDVTAAASLYLLQPKVGGRTTRTSHHQGMDSPPETTGKASGRVHQKRAKEKRRDFTVDWVHLKLNDQTQRTVLIEGPVPLAR